jgi:CheY-like chemotaxis protein
MPILIVDDNSVMRRAIRRVVHDLTDRTIECADGAEVSAAFEKHQPEWILMDIKMKGKDGLTATREICAAYPSTRVVIVTNYDDEEFREAARNAGAIGFVIKDNLLELREIITVRKTNQSAKARFQTGEPKN